MYVLCTAMCFNVQKMFTVMSSFWLLRPVCHSYCLIFSHIFLAFSEVILGCFQTVTIWKESSDTFWVLIASKEMKKFPHVNCSFLMLYLWEWKRHSHHCESIWQFKQHVTWTQPCFRKPRKPIVLRFQNKTKTEDCKAFTVPSLGFSLTSADESMDTFPQWGAVTVREQSWSGKSQEFFWTNCCSWYIP